MVASDRELENRIRAIVESEGSYELKHMFGGSAFMLNGNMACGITRGRLLLRLDPGEFESILKLPFVNVFDISGRAAKGWVTIAPEAIAADQELRKWVLKGVAYARTLPAK